MAGRFCTAQIRSETVVPPFEPTAIVPHENRASNSKASTTTLTTTTKTTTTTTTTSRAEERRQDRRNNQKHQQKQQVEGWQCGKENGQQSNSDNDSNDDDNHDSDDVPQDRIVMANENKIEVSRWLYGSNENDNGTPPYTEHSANFWNGFKRLSETVFFQQPLKLVSAVIWNFLVSANFWNHFQQIAEYFYSWLILFQETRQSGKRRKLFVTQKSKLNNI